MKKSSHVIWVCPTSHFFFRSKGEVRCRPGSVIPKLVDEGMKINVLIPYDPTLLPKTKLSSTRVTRHVLKLSQKYTVEITKLTRGTLSPGVYMASLPSVEPALWNALFSKAALELARQLKRPVDIFHLFEWETGLVPLYLELEKKESRIFKNTRTFFHLSSLQEKGSYAPAVLNYLDIPKSLFHPEGIEFFGRVSFLKTGLVFADGVGIIEGKSIRAHAHRNGHGFEGVLDAQSHKLRRWASDRSLRSHRDAYSELLAMTDVRSVLPHLLEKVHNNDDDFKRFIESWGPPPPERTNVNSLSFLIQSPTKAYAFWEWISHDYTDYGLRLEDCDTGTQVLLSRGQPSMGDFWFEVLPGRGYIVELVGFRADGTMQPLLRSRLIRTPRNSPSPHTTAIFIDVRDRRRFKGKGTGLGVSGKKFMPGGTSAFEWSVVEMPSSFRESVSSL